MNICYTCLRTMFYGITCQKRHGVTSWDKIEDAIDVFSHGWKYRVDPAVEFDNNRKIFLNEV